MTRAVMLLVLSGLFFGLGAFCGNLTLESSTFIPDPGGSVTLFVRGASSGATFRWDLDGDGTYELTTARASGYPYSSSGDARSAG
jgi:hypothetical protein